MNYEQIKHKIRKISNNNEEINNNLDRVNYDADNLNKNNNIKIIYYLESNWHLIP